MPRHSPANSLVRGADCLQGLARGLAVLKALNASPAGATIAWVARQVNTTRAGARRILLTLLELGYVRQDGHLFILTSKVLELGVSAAEAESMWDVVDGGIAALVEETGETASAAVLEGHEILYVARCNPSRPIHFAIRPGSRLPAHATSLGWALLAELPDRALTKYLSRGRLEKLGAHTVTDPQVLRRALEAVRRDGHAYVEAGIDDRICGIAVPLLDPLGQAVAAINIGTRLERYDRARIIAELLPALLAAKNAIESRLRSFSPRGKLLRTKAPYAVVGGLVPLQ
jgi:IclR family transcriptional regulator, pca regulon regulatory protein